METPIYNALKEKIKNNYISFHTPGHKGKNALLDWSKCVPQMDTTEIEGTDSLLDPQGIIKASQDFAAKVYNTKATYYSVNGSTGSIHISLSTITNPGDKVLIQRNCHKAVYNGIILNRLHPVYINPHYNEKYNITTGIDLKDLEGQLKSNPDIKAVVITYPDYYGICSDIEAIAGIVHRYHGILMVDEAHGSHFSFSTSLPKSSIEAGADIVVQSVHKTLPSLTQTSLIHVCSDGINIDKLRRNFQLYTTTSPSYLFMMSCEAAISYVDGNRHKMDENIHKVKKLVKGLKSMKGVHVFTGDEEDRTIYNKDITKILLSIDGHNGKELLERLHREFHIDMEMADAHYVLALTTMMNQEEDFERLYDAIEKISKHSSSPSKDTIKSLPKPQQKLLPHEAYYMDVEKVKLERSIGRISATTITPYPPGIPLVVPGEVITQEIWDYIQFLKDFNIEISGFLGYNKEYIGVTKERC